ncbi:MAG: hypothetical protein IT212_07710 [Bacteroidia bacterium]|nr:hypothetical protein [Bacteroidia bacterium]
MKVLGYMVRNNIGGIYVMRRNFRKDIAKAIGSSPDNVRNILQILQRKKLINFISNERGGNYGAYGFNPVVESICYGKDSVTLNFVRNPVNNKIDK